MRRAWLAGLLALAGCAVQPPGPGAARAVADGPSPFDYVIYASMADAAMPLQIASFEPGEALETSEVAMQLQ